MNALLILKALHIFGFISWMAGLFYIVRIFVYHREAWEEPKEAQDILIPRFETMERRAYKIIIAPAMGITFIGGFGMLFVNNAYWTQTWIYIKLGMVLILYAYQLLCKRMMKQLSERSIQWTDHHYRLFNEFPTIVMLAIILLAVFRDTLQFLTAFGILLVFALLLLLGIRAYKRHRMRNSA